MKIRITNIHKILQAQPAQSIDKRIVVYAGSNTFLNSEILAMRMRIANDCPELLPYLNEMPRPFQDTIGLDISRRELQHYYEALRGLLNGYLAANPLPPTSD